MLNFLKNTFSTVLGILLSFLVIFLIIIGVASISSQKNKSIKQLDKKHFLKIDLSNVVAERTSSNPLSNLTQ